jgi:hypothetical protein
MKNEINDPIIIDAVFVRETKDAILFDCEGDLEWFPKKNINFDSENDELEVERWILKQKFPDESY